MVKGLPWCPTEAKSVGVSSLTAKILCAEHNNALSRLDESASETKTALMERLTRPQNPKKSFKVENLHVSGADLERWCLKATLGVERTHDSSINPGCDLVKACFGNGTLRNPAGLYLAANIGEDVPNVDALHFNALHRGRGDRPIGWRLGLWGWRFLLWLDDRVEPNHFTDFRAQGLVRHLQQIKFVEGKRLRQRLHFGW
jgi:hypothetical protein